MKLISKLILTVLVLLGLPMLAYAQEQPTTTGDYFNVELSLGTQSAWTKKVPILIKFRSNINADKVEISWDMPANLKLSFSHPKFIKVQKDQVYTYKAYIKPLSAGTYNIAGNVTAWELETNYTSSGYTTLTFDKQLITVPQTAGYTGSMIVKYLIYLLLLIGGGAGAYFGAKLGMKRLKEWLIPPE